MNRVLIYGGLGNQMFQYAFNVALNKRGKKSQILFSNLFYEDHHAGFNLGYAFDLQLPFPLNFYNFLLLKADFLYQPRIQKSILRRLIGRNIQKKQIIYNELKEFVYDEEVFHQESKLFIGIWQVEKYFKDIEQTLREIFRFNRPTDSLNIAFAQRMQNTEAVSIHIRRGDYLKSEWSESHLVIKGINYYNNALEYINKHVKDPRFYIFSDNIEWVKNNLKIPNAVYLNHNTGKNSCFDMYLMSICKHNIIANSTFSWWGAWLNQNTNKIVLMPEKWLNSNDCPGIFPNDWVRIKI